MPKIIDSTFFMKRGKKKKEKIYNLCFSQAKWELIIFGYYFNLFVRQFALFCSYNGTNHLDKTYIDLIAPLFFSFLLSFFLSFFFIFYILYFVGWGFLFIPIRIKYSLFHLFLPLNHLMIKSNTYMSFCLLFWKIGHFEVAIQPSFDWV